MRVLLVGLGSFLAFALAGCSTWQDDVPRSELAGVEQEPMTMEVFPGEHQVGDRLEYVVRSSSGSDLTRGDPLQVRAQEFLTTRLGFTVLDIRPVHKGGCTLKASILAVTTPGAGVDESDPVAVRWWEREGRSTYGSRKRAGATAALVGADFTVALGRDGGVEQIEWDPTWVDKVVAATPEHDAPPGEAAKREAAKKEIEALVGLVRLIFVPVPRGEELVPGREWTDRATPADPARRTHRTIRYLGTVRTERGGLAKLLVRIHPPEGDEEELPAQAALYVRWRSAMPVAMDRLTLLRHQELEDVPWLAGRGLGVLATSEFTAVEPGPTQAVDPVR